MIVQRVLVVSDSHGISDHIKKIIDKHSPISLFIHLGDIGEDPKYIREWLVNPNVSDPNGVPAVFIRGNCDHGWLKRKLSKSEVIIELNGNRVLLTHGHHFHVDDGMDELISFGARENIQLILHGHTHIPLNQKFGDIRILCPGSVSFPSKGKPKSYLILDFEKDGSYEARLCTINDL